MEVLLIIIAIIWFILNVALFFKIWNMTNDVKVIKNLLTRIYKHNMHQL